VDSPKGKFRTEEIGELESCPTCTHNYLRNRLGARTRRPELNEYEKAFVEHVTRLKIGGPNFAKLAREALEAEYGGEIDALFSGLSQETLESPERFAAEVFKTFGKEAMPYYVTILKYAESGLYQPEQDSEQEKEEEELESIIHKIEPDSGGEAETDSRT
jgi:hypothetical protein